MKPAPSSIVSSNSTKLNTGTIPRFLIIETKAEVEALLKSRFAAQIYIETLPVPDAIAGDNAYDVLIWNSDNSTSHKAKGLEMLERVSRRSPETQIIVISHEEGSPARFRIRSKIINISPGLLIGTTFWF